MLVGDQADVAHELAWGLEAQEVLQLGHLGHGGDELHAAHGLQATGTLNMSGGNLILEGERLGEPSAGRGAGMTVGRDDGTATAVIGNGSTITINATAPSGSRTRSTS